jgi:hypothetical protein
MSDAPSIAAKAARCPDQAAVTTWAKKHGIAFVNRSHGEQTTTTISMAALVDLAGHWSESEAVAIVPVGVMEGVKEALDEIDDAFPAGMGEVDGPWTVVATKDYDQCALAIRKAVGLIAALSAKADAVDKEIP